VSPTSIAVCVTVYHVWATRLGSLRFAPLAFFSFSFVSQVFDVHFCGFGAIADHDRLAETSLRSYGTAIKGLAAPAAVIWGKKEYNAVLEFLPVPRNAPLLGSCPGAKGPAAAAAVLGGYYTDPSKFDKCDAAAAGGGGAAELATHALAPAELGPVDPHAALRCGVIAGEGPNGDEDASEAGHWVRHPARRFGGVNALNTAWAASVRCHMREWGAKAWHATRHAAVYSTTVDVLVILLVIFHLRVALTTSCVSCVLPTTH